MNKYLACNLETIVKLNTFKKFIFWILLKGNGFCELTTYFYSLFNDSCQLIYSNLFYFTWIFTIEMRKKKWYSYKINPLFKTHRIILISIKLIKNNIKSRFQFRKGSMIKALNLLILTIWKFYDILLGISRIVKRIIIISIIFLSNILFF